jgi:hypothetical protein
MDGKEFFIFFEDRRSIVLKFIKIYKIFLIAKLSLTLILISLNIRIVRGGL